jgi:hypothetical protein
MGMKKQDKDFQHMANNLAAEEDQKILEAVQAGSDIEDEGRPLQQRVKQEEATNDPAQFTGQFADQFQSKKFIDRWATMLWTAMQMSGEGYRKDSMKRTGKGGDRRGDKLEGTPKLLRQYQARYA